MLITLSCVVASLQTYLKLCTQQPSPHCDTGPSNHVIASNHVCNNHNPEPNHVTHTPANHRSLPEASPWRRTSLAMGQVLSYVSYFFSWGAPASSYSTDPDPDTGLSEYDRQLISMTWALAADKKVRKKNGVEFFMQLFKAYPYMLDYFPSFKGRELDDLRNDPKLKAHALSVMFAIGSFVDSMDDPEALVGLVRKLAVSHVQRDIKAGQFEDLAKMFIPFLDSLLGDSNTPDIKAAWTKLLGAQSAIVKQTETEMSNENTG